MLKPVSHILTLLVNNEFGVLTRVSSQIRREGWNIKSLAVAETTNPVISRITLCLECFDVNLPGVLHKLRRLQCVRSVTLYDAERFVCRELAVVRFTPREKENTTLDLIGVDCQVCQLFQEGDTQVLELTGSPDDLSRYIQALQSYGEVAAARTGAITLEKCAASKEELL